MSEIMDVDRGADQCRLELFGVARLRAGVKEVVIPLRAPTPLGEIVRMLAMRRPELVGLVINPDRRGLADGHIFNLNGRDFLIATDALVRPGDRVLLLSSSAGG